MASVKSWKVGQPGSPHFPAQFEIARKAVLQRTDFKANNNKYYAIELHTATEGGKQFFRVYTHYGRTDDLERNPESGQKECRYLDDLGAAQATYESIYREKTGPSKGYKELSLASSRIGSEKARGTSAGDVDAKTLEKLAKAKAEKEGKQPRTPAQPALDIHPSVRDLVQHLFEAATHALTTTVQAKITANGIETPLGILTVGQIEKGEAILKSAYDVFKDEKIAAKRKTDQLESLSGEFYTLIPHRLGRTRDDIAAAVLNSVEHFSQKQETLQLMKDMLEVSGDDSAVLFENQVDAQFRSLKCEMVPVDSSADEFRALKTYIEKSQIKTKTFNVRQVFKVKRPGEHDGFTHHIDNQRKLFHGSRVQNWVGLLSRGILMPKVVVAMGVHRTDAGWLGNGIYFGDAACTSAFYTTPGKRGTRFLAVCNVALGKMAEYTKITYGLTEPPAGYDSCHGVRRKLLKSSQFDDDEYVIYRQNQQRMDYLVEFTV